MKKIIFSSYDDLKNPYYGGGGALVFHEVAKRLAQEYNIVVYTGSYPGAKKETLDGVSYNRVGFSHAGPFFGQLLFPIFLLPKVIFDTYDVWFESFTPPWSTSFLPIFARRPFIGVTQFFDADAKAKQYKIPFQYLEKMNLKCYKYVVALTKIIKQKLNALSPNTHVFLIPNGVDLPKTYYQRAKEKSYILFIGRLEINQKGLDLLLTAFAKASLFIKDNLYIAGTGHRKDVEHIEAKIKELEIGHRVSLLGKVVGTKKEELLAHTKYVVIPSRYESLCIVGLEALAYGKPVISFDIPGLQWMPKSVAMKVNNFSVTDFARSLILLSRNGTERKRIKRKALLLIKQYNWDRVARLYKDVITKVLWTQ